MPAVTESTEVGRLVMTAAAERFARVPLEVSNRGPNIIATDADLGTAIKGSPVGAFLNSPTGPRSISRGILDDGKVFRRPPSWCCRMRG